MWLFRTRSKSSGVDAGNGQAAGPPLRRTEILVERETVTEVRRTYPGSPLGVLVEAAGGDEAGLLAKPPNG
jgi:hypothetical protein